MRLGYRHVLHETGAAVTDAATGADGLKIVRRDQPDVVFLDVDLPDIVGSPLLDQLLLECSRTHVIALSMYDDPSLAHRLLERGVAGFITKRDNPEAILRAIACAYEGAVFISSFLAPCTPYNIELENRLSSLSPRDRWIVELLGEGKCLSEISYEIGRTYKTTANVTNIIRHKLGIRTNSLLIRFAVERRLHLATERALV